jgi:phosphoribosylglycinamide formyltransferase-1
VAVLCSRRAPGAADLLASPARGQEFELVAAVATEPESADLPLFRAAGIPVLVRDLREHCARRRLSLRDPQAREEFDEETARALQGHAPDVLLLLGYLYRVAEPLLDRYRDRVLNIHDADLCRRDGQGRPRFPGLHATRDAILAGERETRSTLHLVTEEIDAGPPLVRSWPFPVHALAEDARRWGAWDILKAYAYAHREWMMRAAWGRMAVRALEAFAAGELLVRDGTAYVRGRPGPVDLPPPADDRRGHGVRRAAVGAEAGDG